MAKLAHRFIETRAAVEPAAAKPKSEIRMGPDPLIIVLPALAALGCIASVAALNWAARDHDGEKRRGRRQAQGVLRDLGRDCVDLQDVFKRLIRGLPGIASASGGSSALPLKFGMHGLQVSDDTYPLFQSLVASTASLILRSSQNSRDLTCAIEDGSIVPTDGVFYAFADAQDRLNQLLSVRPSLKISIETGYDIAVKLTGLVEELKAYVAGA